MQSLTAIVSVPSAESASFLTTVRSDVLLESDLLKACLRLLRTEVPNSRCWRLRLETPLRLDTRRHSLGFFALTLGVSTWAGIGWLIWTLVQGLSQDLGQPQESRQLIAYHRLDS
jgi:hypothetical protein